MLRVGLFLRRVDAELMELLTHREAGDPQPTRGLGLVTVGKVDRTAEDFTFGGRQKLGVGVSDLASLGGGQQLVHVLAQG